MNLKKHLACLEIWDKGDLRLLFETKIIVMWSADNDLANLKKDFDIDIEFLVDLQSKFTLISALQYNSSSSVFFITIIYLKYILVVESNNRAIMQLQCEKGFRKEYQREYQPATNKRLSLKRAYDYFIDSKSELAKYKLGMKGQDYSVWGDRPLNEELLGYAAFDVASLRQLLQKFSRIVDFTNEDVVWTVLQDSKNRKEPVNERINVKSERIQKQC